VKVHPPEQVNRRRGNLFWRVGRRGDTAQRLRGLVAFASLVEHLPALKLCPLHPLRIRWALLDLSERLLGLLLLVGAKLRQAELEPGLKLVTLGNLNESLQRRDRLGVLPLLEQRIPEQEDRRVIRLGLGDLWILGEW